MQRLPMRFTPYGTQYLRVPFNGPKIFKLNGHGYLMVEKLERGKCPLGLNVENHADAVGIGGESS